MFERLEEAKTLVNEVMSQGGTILDQYSIKHTDLTFGSSIGMGSFGTVFKGTLRGVITVAIKTMRVDKVTKQVVSKARYNTSLALLLSTCL